MSGFAVRARTALALGIPNILRAGGYRLGVRLGVHAVQRLPALGARGPFFRAASAPERTLPAARATWRTQGLLFSRWPIDIGVAPPDWHANPLTGAHVTYPSRPWWEIPDFDPAVGDIKLIWELSRMDWAVAFAQQAKCGDRAALDRLNSWLEDWCARNPTWLGANWKCGQEASLRTLHLVMAAAILGQTADPAPGLLDLVRIHLRRIAPTLAYATAQDNNHGTSEAVALFVGGEWLRANGDATAGRFAVLGRRHLEERVGRLIGSDGSFSQYSLNYHRLMLDTVAIAEWWRRLHELPEFSPRFQARARAATLWLQHAVDVVTGDGPNVGANDGASFLQLTDSEYRDHRPSLQLAMSLFVGARAIEDTGPWDDVLRWLDIDIHGPVAAAPRDLLADDGGFAYLRRGAAFALMRFPRFQFRPQQADALHVDLWVRGRNVLRDAGTYSYFDIASSNYFTGVTAHNTVQFDGRDPMPRVARFLFGDWLESQRVTPISRGVDHTRFGAGYVDRLGASHRREVELGEKLLRVGDEFGGFGKCATLRWRLVPGDWRLDGRVLSGPGLQLRIDATVPIESCELVQGFESRHYLERTPLPVLEVVVRQAGRITTEVTWA